MYLKYYDKLPRNDYLILLNTVGEPSLRVSPSIKIADNITNKIVTVYNTKTDRVSDKSVYLNTKGIEYITGTKGMFWSKNRFYLKDFKED